MPAVTKCHVSAGTGKRTTRQCWPWTVEASGAWSWFRCYLTWSAGPICRSHSCLTGSVEPALVPCWLWEWYTLTWASGMCSNFTLVSRTRYFKVRSSSVAFNIFVLFYSLIIFFTEGAIHDINMIKVATFIFLLPVTEPNYPGSRPYNTEILENFMKTKFSESGVMSSRQFPRCVVPATIADCRPCKLHVFKNYGFRSENDLPPPHLQKIWEATRGSSAAPTYFTPHKRFVDGGLMANNPTITILTEMHECNQDPGKLGYSEVGKFPSFFSVFSSL